MYFKVLDSFAFFFQILLYSLNQLLHISVSKPSATVSFTSNFRYRIVRMLARSFVLTVLFCRMGVVFNYICDSCRLFASRSPSQALIPTKSEA